VQNAIMIQFDDISLAFAGHTLFENVSFTIQKGERCGLVGRNGSGKSTLFRLIDGELEPDRGMITLPKNYRIGFLQQHIRFTEPSLIQEAARALPPQEKEQRFKAERILFGLGFTEEDLDAPPSSFSGGFHLRLHLAKVLIAEPDCLLLDEPTNYLDILSMRWLTHFLSRWPHEFILISHDREFMDKVTTHTMGIHREKVRKIKGSTLDFFQQILLEEEVHEKTRAKQEKKRAQVQKFVDRFGAKATKATQAQSKLKQLAREPVLEKLHQLSELSFSFHAAPFPGRKLLEATDLHFSFTEGPLIEKVSLEVEKGERVAIIGKNGRGKSTLLRLLSGDLKPQKGEVKISENTKLGYFGQTHVERLNLQNTIENEISSANPFLNYTEIKTIAGGMLFSGTLAEKKISVLSGGERSRVLLGKIIAKPCNLLLLDEPTHHLDIESIEALIDALEDFSGGIILVTHSELILHRLNLDKIIVCGPSKQSLFLGSYDDFLEKKGWEEEKKTPLEKKSQSSGRRERAEWVAKRAAELKPIEKKIREFEKQLGTLEEEQKKSQQVLGSGQTSPLFLKELGQRQKQIEDLETQLYALYELFESKKKELETI
jgi:ATP-binding cassette subfamily F protein 3